LYILIFTTLTWASDCSLNSVDTVTQRVPVSESTGLFD